MTKTDKFGCALLEYVRRVDAETFSTCIDVYDVEEWRVAFAGQLYPRNFIGKYRGPWSQARLLMEEPFEIVTCVGLPRHGHEQLCIRFPDIVREEKYGSTTIHGGNSEEILDELLSVISLLARVRLRLISRSATYVAPAYLRQDFGDPRVRRLDRIIGARMPQAILGHPDAESLRAEAYCDLDGVALAAFLGALANDPHGDVFVEAARIFATALEFQDLRPEVAYLLLVSSVESLARIAYDQWTPTLDDMRRSREPLVAELRRLSLGEAQVESILRASCVGNPWVARKFERYLEEHVTRPIRCPGLSHIEIGPDKLHAVAQTIYRARSTMSHGAAGLPPTASYGGGSRVAVRSAAALMEATTNGWDRGKVPPVAWFLRAVAVAHRTFVCKRLGIERCPVGECTENDTVAETP
jgi:hypothetical protein